MLFEHSDTHPLLYGITPPKRKHDQQALIEIAIRQVRRIRELDIDGLILYDIQDEKQRTPEERPFPYLPTIAPYLYAEEFLTELPIPKIIYRCVGKHSAPEFSEWLTALKSKPYYIVFVGSASHHEKVSLRLPEAYDLKKDFHPELKLGGIAIPERHQKDHKEHLRILEKQSNGCSFFITQTVYDVQISKNLVSDYYYSIQKNSTKPNPIVFTFSICGSLKTLEFMKWLGINFPKWLENDLNHSRDIMNHSFNVCLNNVRELLDYSTEKNIPIGFNIESVSIRKEEIDASIALVNETRKIINSYQT